LQVGDGILDDERFEGGAEVLWIWRIAVAEAGITGKCIGSRSPAAMTPAR
jgi:hypothetical protein